MKILDLSAGWRWIWHDPHHRDTVYLDRRAEVAPDVVADSRCLPFKQGVFDLVVFDPPHVNFGASANMSRDYGHHTTVEIREIVRNTGKEAHRVCRPDALMAFKWNDHDQPQGTILALLLCRYSSTAAAGPRDGDLPRHVGDLVLNRPFFLDIPGCRSHNFTYEACGTVPAQQ
jgi:hypothetical protein